MGLHYAVCITVYLQTDRCRSGHNLVTWSPINVYLVSCLCEILNEDGCVCGLDGNGEEAQLVECRTGTPLKQFHSPVRQGIFLPKSSFSADSVTVSVHPHVQSHALNLCARSRSCSPRQSSVHYENTKTQHAR